MNVCFRRLMILTVAACLAAPFVLGTPPAFAQQTPSAQPINNPGLPDLLARWFPKIFGHKDEGPRPEETLQAPFADPEAVQRDKDASAALESSGVIFKSTDGHKYKSITDETTGRRYDIPAYDPDGGEEDSSSLLLAHRRPDQLAEWLVRATSEIFTTDYQNYEQHLKHLGTGMSEAGLAEFQKFMVDSKILTELQTQGMKLMGYVEEPPLLLNEGALNGRYRWLFEMPVTVTFLPRTTQTYKDVERPEDQTLRFIVQTQIGRVDKGPSEDNVVIETWRVRSGEPAAPKKKAP